jgi:hypothetical protein
LTIALAGNEERAEDLCRLISNWKELENAKVSGIRSDKLNIALAQFGCRVLVLLHLVELDHINWVLQEEERLDALYQKLDQGIKPSTQEGAFLEAMRSGSHALWIMDLEMIVYTVKMFRLFGGP